MRSRYLGRTLVCRIGRALQVSPNTFPSRMRPCQSRAFNGRPALRREKLAVSRGFARHAPPEKHSQTFHEIPPHDPRNPSGAPERAREHWKIQKLALEKKFGEAGWLPRKKLSPDTMEMIRSLHSQDTERNSTKALAQQFEVSPEAIRRILKSKWRASEEEQADRMRRWENRGERIWTRLAMEGLKPPKKWRERGIGRASRLPPWGPSSDGTKSQDVPGDRPDSTSRLGTTYADSLAKRIL